MKKTRNLVINPGDYVIGLDDNAKNPKKYLMQVSQVQGQLVSGTLDADRAYNPKNAEFTLNKIVCVLGPKPVNGSAFGIRIEPYLRTLEHPDWGNVHWFVDMSKEDKIVLKNALSRVAKLLKRKGLFGFVADGNLELEVLPPRGRWAGMYMFRQKGDVAMDRMQLRPKPGQANDYVVAHEAGHGVWYRLLSDRQRARWVQFYTKFTKSIEHDKELIADLGQRFIEERIELKSFRSTLPAEETELFDLIISTISSTHRLGAKHLNMLVTNDLEDEIKKLWPKVLEDSDFEMLVSDYGTTNPDELFADAFAFWLTGCQKIPKSVQTLMDKTIQKIAQRGKE